MITKKNRKSDLFYFFLGLILSISITVIRHMTGAAFQIEQFYLIPIVIVSWYVNKEYAIVIATISILFWIIFDYFTLQTLYGNVALGLNEVFRLFIFIFIILLIDSYKNQINFFKTLSGNDPLTNLFNRRAFFQFVDHELERARRYAHHISLLYIDLDNFKEINDTLGHDIGDELLVEVSEIFKHLTRETDIIGRMGGDEFCIVLPETHLNHATLVYNKLNISITKMMTQKNWNVSMSVGIVYFKDKPSNSENMVAIADEVMYAVKKSGKNSFLTKTFEIKQT